VSRVISCAFLAPEIVEAIMDGRQDDELTLGNLMGNVPMSWRVQRQASS
jgi:hypothetical protein